MGLDQYITYKAEKENEVYFRKFNFLRRYLIDEGLIEEEDNLTKRPLTVMNLIQLHAHCTMVLDKPERANKLLPTMDGFFYGDTRYDEAYFEDVAYLKEQLEVILSDETVTEIYYKDWW